MCVCSTKPIPACLLLDPVWAVCRLVVCFSVLWMLWQASKSTAVIITVISKEMAFKGPRHVSLSAQHTAIKPRLILTVYLCASQKVREGRWEGLVNAAGELHPKAEICFCLPPSDYLPTCSSDQSSMPQTCPPPVAEMPLKTMPPNHSPGHNIANKSDDSHHSLFFTALISSTPWSN